MHIPAENVAHALGQFELRPGGKPDLSDVDPATKALVVDLRRALSIRGWSWSPVLKKYVEI